MFLLLVALFSQMTLNKVGGEREGGERVPLVSMVVNSNSPVVSPKAPILPAVVPGPFVCSVEDIERQVPLIRPDTSKCPGHLPWLSLIAAGLSCKPLVIVNIGANKGYSLAMFADLFSPELLLTPPKVYRRIMDRFGDVESGGSVSYPCGACNDCQEEHIVPRNSRTCVLAGGQVVPASSFPVEIHGFEPILSNVDIINEGLMAVYKEGIAAAGPIAPNVKIFIHRAAVVGDPSIEVVPFGMCPPGLERCGVEAAGTTGKITEWNHDKVKIENVKASTVDALSEKFGIPPDIDVLTIDTEGSDPEVLDGAATMLASNRIAVVEFEYHSLRAWKTRTLESVVERLSGYGYDCFLMHDSYLLQLSNCWDAKFEFKDWANVMCVPRANRALLAVLQSQTPAFHVK